MFSLYQKTIKRLTKFISGPAVSIKVNDGTFGCRRHTAVCSKYTRDVSRLNFYLFRLYQDRSCSLQHTSRLHSYHTTTMHALLLTYLRTCPLQAQSLVTLHQGSADILVVNYEDGLYVCSCCIRNCVIVCLL